MKRVYIALCIFAFCAAFSFFSYQNLTHHCRQMIALTESVEQAALAQDSALVKEKSEQLKARWNHDSLPFSLLTTHVHYDKLAECVDKLYHAAMREDEKQIQTDCEDLIFEAAHIISGITPKCENVF